MDTPRSRSPLVRAARWVLCGLAGAVAMVLVALGVLQTDSAKDRLRDLVVRQANRYLDATLTIGELRGSLFGGVLLRHVRVSRGGETLVSIDEVSLTYRLPELFDAGTRIRHLRLVAPRVVVGRGSDGRLELATLFKREAAQGSQRGPGRPIQIGLVEVVGGAVRFNDPVTVGALHIPSVIDDLAVRLAFTYRPVAWDVAIEQASWSGRAPEHAVTELAGGIGDDGTGLRLRDLRVVTPRSRVTVDGSIDRRNPPTVVDLTVGANPLTFQEWSGVLTGLKNIAVVARFQTKLRGPLAALNTGLTLQSDGGDVRGTFVLDTTAPGWRGTGAVTIERIDLARWLNRPNQASNITGDLTFDLTDMGLRAGGRFPRGGYRFAGAHAAYAGYRGENVAVEGHVTSASVHIARGSATAYGADVTLSDGEISVDAPYRFSFTGATSGADLRGLPAAVPVPHVESRLAFSFDVTGRFATPFIRGLALFGPSSFLGADVGDGATGTIDTSGSAVTYAGEGDIAGIDLHRFGAGLEVAWLQEPRYAGTVSGRFRVEGRGATAATLRLSSSGRLARAQIFGGHLTDAAVMLDIREGTLTGSFDGRLADIDPAIAMNDTRYAASLTGSGRGRIRVAHLLDAEPDLEDYTVEVEATLARSRFRTLAFDTLSVTAAMADGTLGIASLNASAPAFDISASGPLDLGGAGDSNVSYTVAGGDLSLVGELTGRSVQGYASTSGRLTGPLAKLRAEGDATIARIDLPGLWAGGGRLHYDVTIPDGDLARARGTLNGSAAGMDVFGRVVENAEGTARYDQGRVTLDVRGDTVGTHVASSGTFVLHADRRALDLESWTIALPRSTWRLASSPRAVVNWDDRGITLSHLAFEEATGHQRLSVEGTWYPEGGGRLRVAARQVSLDMLFAEDGPSRYGGRVDLDATIRGGRAEPMVEGQIAVTDGRFWRVGYDSLRGRIDYTDKALAVDLRLDERPGVWLTARGRVPLAVFDARRPPEPLDLALSSSSIDLGLLEGMTEVARDVTGVATLDVRVLGTSRDPHFDGRIDITGAGFVAAASGVRYKAGRVALRLTTERITVDAFHLEDDDGDALEVTGSLGTHERQIGDLALEVRSHAFDVLRNEYGRLDVDTRVVVRGQFEAPRLQGRVSVTAGVLDVDAILNRTMLQSYAAYEVPGSNGDPLAALGPWDHLGLDLELHVPGTLRLVGDNVQLTPGTPLGFGDINLRAIGDLYLYKDPGQPLYVTGSLDSVTGTYAFQGRRFDLDPISSINFRGDHLNPELYVMVSREISGVDTRVTIAGPLQEPELRLSSIPPLEPSDVLSLIVFNTSTNELSALQQQQLAVRAGTLAAGFLAAPMMSALERSLGLDTLEIDPGTDIRGGARVTIGNEIAPGLVARFSRQFGDAPYDQATLEYYLSRLFRIRATFSDAGVLRSPFRRVERAGIDLLLLLSF